MKCQNCNTQIEEDALFCPECGARQAASEESSEERALYCPCCGKPLEEGACFCAECGKRVDGSAGMEEGLTGKFTVQPSDKDETEETVFGQPELSEEPEMIYKKKGGSAPVVIGLLLVSILIFGGIGYAIYSAFFKPAEDLVFQTEEDSDENMEAGEEVDLSEVDINAADNSRCYLQGKIKKANNGAYVLGWSEGLTIYGLDELGGKGAGKGRD